jgi:hypothetical protein
MDINVERVFHAVKDRLAIARSDAPAELVTIG